MTLKAALVTYKNSLLFVLGYMFVALGVIGMVLPVMPTTVFFILALACFTRASPKLAQKLLSHPRFGHTLQLWQQYRVIPFKAKIMALLGMAVSFCVLLVLSPATWIACVVGSIKLLVGSYILAKPSKVLL
ncbi:YbaN family protein [Pseudoalteromonas spongiae]|uniref:YbaN family protein n=1 Tax=Pseudoalteromonas spongiae TaxID=298657 RepID=UPI003736B47F